MAPSPPPPPLPKDRLRMMAKHWSEGRLEQWNEKGGRRDSDAKGSFKTRKIGKSEGGGDEGKFPR